MGDHRLLARLGAGGMGVVYLGRSPGGRAVAVKVVRERFAGDAVYRARFRREVAAARRVTGTFTAPVLDADPEAAAPWLVTAYLPGPTLWEAVDAFGSLPPTAVRVLAAALAEALADIHRAGLAHRDLKPGNIVLTAGGPRVIDFGITRPEDATAITRVGSVVGTPGFMAPEQLSGGATGPAGDVFSLGAVLVFAATGEAPFGAAEVVPRRARAELDGVTDPDLRALVAACLSREPRRRPTAADLLERLGDGTVSVQGTGWLPAPLAQEIDRRTARARHLPDPPADRPVPALSGPAAADPALMGEATVDPAAAAPPDGTGPEGRGEDTAPTGSRGPTRRRVIAAGAAALAAAGGAVALWRGRGPDRAVAKDASGPSRPPSRAPSTPPAPARAVPRWKVRVGDYYPDLFAAGGLVLARSEEDLRALDPRTGKVRWTRSTALDGTSIARSHGGPAAGDATAGDTAYVADSRNGKWRLSAVHAASGATRWTYRLPFGELPLWTVATGPVVCFGHGRIRALGAADGQPRWTADVGAEGGLAAVDGTVAAVNDAELVGLDADSGRTGWTYRLDQGLPPRTGNGLVFLCDRHGTLHAVRADSGEGVWRRSVGGVNFGSGLQPGDGMLYVGGGGGDVLALEAETGEIVWSRRLGRNEGAPYGHSNALGLSGDTLYVGCTDRTAYALDAADGRVLWTHPADVTLTSGPVAAAGLVFVGTRDGHVQALEAPNGGPRAGT
ncbi:PQQ-binding-like beta-propeller repeat protein [Streptomyces macrosporus]|uniref:outer membrane protein assembly factor BamB family protein n=1 Tax=Streptomyces macrosporus TaxID=44032 RepID=UPI0031D0CCE3